MSTLSVILFMLVSAIDTRLDASPQSATPVLQFGTYFGGRGYDSGTSVAISSGGSAFLAGFGNSSDLPLTRDAVQRQPGPGFLSRFDSAGRLQYSTYFGDQGLGGVIDIVSMNDGGVVAVGNTLSAGFQTKNAFQPTFGGNIDAFVTRFDAAGQLVFSSFLGGSGRDYARSVAVDEQGNIVIIGSTDSTNFPVHSAMQPSNGGGENDSFVTLVTAEGALGFSTYLGGDGRDSLVAVASDRGENFILLGSTDSRSTFLPHGPAVIACGDTTLSTALLIKLLRTGTVQWASTLGSCDLGPTALAVTGGGSLLVAGSTSTRFLPTTPSALQRENPRGDRVAFLLGIDSTGSHQVLGTYLPPMSVSDMVVASNGTILLVGSTSSPTFPVSDSALVKTLQGGTDGFFMQLSAAASSIVYSTLIGGDRDDVPSSIATSRDGYIAITGVTRSLNLPVRDAYQPSLQDYDDAFLFVFRSAYVPKRRSVAH